ncbi:hypothetical protein OFM13_31160, partial [Escherichia coli]|nr:hypothetical protein [Escherichia coli]
AGKGTAGKFVTDGALYNETRAAISELRASAAKFNLVVDDLKTITGRIIGGEGSAGKLFKDDRLYEKATETLARFNSTAEKLDLSLED